MAGIIFLIIAAFLFSIIGVIVLLVRSSRQKELLREYGERLQLVEGALRLFQAAPPEPALPVETGLAERVPEGALSPAAETLAAVGVPPGPDPHVTPDLPSAFPAEETPAEDRPRSSLGAFVRGGNLWAAGGIVLLLAGFATLVTYLAGRGFFTVEMGIAAAALSGLVMLVLGWGFREKRPVYFLLLQGGGIGILYFSVFAAHRLTPYFPPALGLALMSVLIPPAIVLALFQNSQVLALAGFLGGFAAPLLMAGRGENPVFLFAYYLVLDLGVLGIACFRRWKVLNLLALLCSFVLANAWTLASYRPGFFWSAEPFFLAYILIFTVLGLRGFGGASGLDLALVLGTPALGALLQWKLFETVEHGHALVSLVFSALYILLALVIRGRGGRDRERGILREVYLSLGVLLANLAIPLELTPRFTSALWAAEALVVFIFGLRQKRRRIIAAGLVFHAAGAVAFFFEAGLFGPGGGAFRSAGFTGSLIIALSALAMLFYAGHSPQPRPALSMALGIWGFVWWFGGWSGEIYRVFADPAGGPGSGPVGRAAAILFLVCSLSALGAWGASRFLGNPLFLLGIIPSLAGGLLLFLRFSIVRIPGLFTRRPSLMLSYNYFTGLFLWAWPAFFAVQGLLIFFSRKTLREDLHGSWILIFSGIGLGVLSSSGRSLARSWDLTPAWISFAGLLPVFAAMAGIVFSARRPALSFPVETGGTAGRMERAERAERAGGLLRPRLVFFILPLVLSGILGLWFLASLFFPGDPAPLPCYVPILNILDLEELFCVALFLLWQSALMKRGDLPVLKKRDLFIVVDLAVFLYTMAAAARGLHFYRGIPYRDLAHSDVFHLSLFILWAVYGMGHIIGGHRLALRRLWIAGAVLMVADIAKFLLLDQAKAGAATRIVSFFLAGLLLLFIGWAAPLPPAAFRRGEGENDD
jgi:uncharacterized membrane protein